MKIKNGQLTAWQRFLLETLWFLARGFARLPHWFKYYAVENLIFVILCYCVRYRRNVVRGNLQNAFPEKSVAELKTIRRKFYRTLAEIFVDTIDLAHMPERKIRRKIGIRNLETFRAAVHGRDWIGLLAHFGCWEYTPYWGFYDRSQMVVSVYKPLNSKVVELFYRRLRGFGNAMTVPMKEAMRFYLRHREKGVDGKNLVLGLIADQSPRKHPDSHWFRFFNQDTLFFDGGEQLALRCGLPVWFLKMERTRRGCYRMSFEQIYDGTETVEPHEITQRYIDRLEAMIREAPELWMWSHRRWKHKRD